MQGERKKATATTFVIIRDGKFLIQERTSDAPRYPGGFCFPGGGPEEGETLMQTVVREVEEEYALKVIEDDCTFLLQYEHDLDPLSGRLDIDDVFAVEVSADQQPILKEGKAFHWLTFEEIKQKDLAWEQDRILPALEAYFRNRQ